MKVFSLFSGVGGFEQGFPKDWECVGFSETDKYANQVLKYRFPNVKNYGDCTKINYKSVPDFDLLVGGSPCQDFSIAGKRRGLAGSRSSLAWEFIRALRDKKPRYFIWENVKGVMSSRGGWDFANLLCAFSESGYSLWWQVLNAKDFGVPQNRERIFVVGSRDESPKEVFFEPKNDGKNNELQGVANNLTTRYEALGTGTYVAQGELNAQQVVDMYNKKIHHDRFPALTSVEKDNYVFDGKVRKLMPIECERLMGWEDDWTKWGINEKGEKVEISDSQRYKMCGNGVVSNVVKMICETLL